MSKEKKPKADFKKAKSFLIYLKPYSSWYAVGFVFLVLTSITSIALPVLLGKLLGTNYGASVPIDIHVNQSDNMGNILMMLAILLPAQAIFSFFRVYTFSYVTQSTLRDLRLAAFQHLVSSPMSFFDKNKVGELTSRIATDTQQIEETLATTLAEFVRQIIVIAAGLGLIFYFSPQLSLIMLAIVPLVAISAMIFGKFIKKLSRKAQDEAAQSNSVLEESLVGIKNLKAYTNEFFEISSYTDAINNIRSTSLKSALWRGIFIAFILTVMLGSVVFIIWQGIELVQTGEISQAEFFQFIFITVMLGTSIGSFPDLYAKIQKTIGATENLMNMMLEPTEAITTATPVKADFKIKGDIELKTVSFFYESRPSVTVLNKINLKVNAGQTLALVGASGSGKSTIASLLLGFYQPVSGEILIDDKGFNNYGLSALRSHIAYVPQEVILFGGSIAENIRYGKPNASDEEVVEAAKKANAHDFITGFPEGYKTLVGDRGIQLSGGQKQRVAIARAVLKNPSVLILDEATSALDSESEHLVQDALDKLMQNRTSIVIAHRLATIKKADQIAVINDGQVVELGTHLELSQKENGLYRKLSEMQFKN